MAVMQLSLMLLAASACALPVVSRQEPTFDQAREMAPAPPCATTVIASSADSVRPTMTDSTMTAARCALLLPADVRQTSRPTSCS